MAAHLPTRARARLLRQCTSHNFSRTYTTTPSLSSSTSIPSPAQPRTSPFAPRHFLSISDLTTPELVTLIRNAATHKQIRKSGDTPPHHKTGLLGKTVAMMFTKRSTRTRVSTEAAVAALGGHAMFLGKEDIQLGVNESLHDSSVVISSMVSAMVARVNAHSDVADLAKYSSVPVINALSDDYHPLQTIADFLTISEAFPYSGNPADADADSTATANSGLGLEGLKIAWIGDANNVLFDLAIGAQKLGVHLSVATPKGYEIPSAFRDIINTSALDLDTSSRGSLSETNIPEEALKDADILVTDTWISMGREAEKIQRLKDFEGYQITPELIKRGGAKENWRFMHCLPRKPEEVDDAVFYGPNSLVWTEAENRLWGAISVLEAFVLNKGRIIKDKGPKLGYLKSMSRLT